MQAIGFLSRREHSQQELRAKLLDSLRKQAREDAALAAAAEQLARAASEPPSNGIDDAFAPRAPASAASMDGAGTRAEFKAKVEVGDDAPADVDLERTDPEAAVDRLLDWLVAHKYLSDARFVESRVNARSRKQGALRIRLELSRHGLTLAPDQAAVLRETEFARAQALWQRKFGEVAADPRQRAKQARFLAARGFAADVVRRLVGGRDED